MIIFLFYTLKYVQGTVRMERIQRVIIKFLLNKQADARVIAGRLQAQFGEHAYKPRMVQFWITEVWLGRQDLHDEIRIGRLPLHDLDIKIVAIWDKYLFEWARLIAETLRIAHSIVLLHLHDSIDFRSFHLYCVLHLLTHDLREERTEYAKAILPFLHAAECDSLYYHITGDEL
jgi:hypothetical protein